MDYTEISFIFSTKFVKLQIFGYNRENI